MGEKMNGFYDCEKEEKLHNFLLYIIQLFTTLFYRVLYTFI